MCKEELYEKLTPEQKEYLDFLIDSAYAQGYNEAEICYSYNN